MLNLQPVCQSNPLYEQVHKVLRSRILSGEWSSQVALPGETALSLEFGVSVGTVRKAMDQLVRDQLVVRERGRGTFTRQGSAATHASMLRFRARNGVLALPQISLVSCKCATATPAQARALWPDDSRRVKPRVLQLAREWRVGDGLVGLETIMLDENRFRGIAQVADLASQRLFATYAEHFRARMNCLSWEIGVPSDASVAPVERLQELRQPAILLRRTAFAERGPIEFCEQLVSLADQSVAMPSP